MAGQSVARPPDAFRAVPWRVVHESTPALALPRLEQDTRAPILPPYHAFALVRSDVATPLPA